MPPKCEGCKRPVEALDTLPDGQNGIWHLMCWNIAGPYAQIDTRTPERTG